MLVEVGRVLRQWWSQRENRKLRPRPDIRALDLTGAGRGATAGDTDPRQV